LSDYSIIRTSNGILLKLAMELFIVAQVGYNLPMKSTRQLTAIIEREADSYVALCPELDIASQGDTVEAARINLIEALELFFESADPTEVTRRLHSEVFITSVEVAVG
jgi:predicted RNase H-like HicB family nuclease